MSENLADELIEFLFDDYTSLDRYIKLYDECEGTIEVFVSKDVIQEKIREFFSD
ncbi:MAG: hypothetical protein ACTSPB_03450 [Candidatus Thorarchaeota archaeon]